MSLLVLASIAIVVWTVLVVVAAGFCKAAARADTRTDQLVTPERGDRAAGGEIRAVRKRWRPATQ